MNPNVDVPCEMCGRYGCDPRHHEPMRYARGGIVNPSSSPVSETKPAPGPEMPSFPQTANETAMSVSMRYMTETYGSKATINRLKAENDRLEAEVTLLRALHAGGCIQTVAKARKALDQMAEKDAEIERLKAERDAARAVIDMRDARTEARQLKADCDAALLAANREVWALKSGLSQSDGLRTRLAADLEARDATIERVQSLLGDTAGPLWSVRGVCEANLQAALNRRAQ